MQTNRLKLMCIALALSEIERIEPHTWAERPFSRKGEVMKPRLQRALVVGCIGFLLLAFPTIKNQALGTTTIYQKDTDSGLESPTGDGGWLDVADRQESTGFPSISSGPKIGLDGHRQEQEWNSAAPDNGQDLISKVAVPDIGFVTPTNGAVFTSTTNVSVTVPLEVVVTDVAVPTAGHWHLWVDGLFSKMVFATAGDVSLMVGTHAVTAELVDALHQPLGPTDTVSVTVAKGLQIEIFLPMVVRAP